MAKAPHDIVREWIMNRAEACKIKSDKQSEKDEKERLARAKKEFIENLKRKFGYDHPENKGTASRFFPDYVTEALAALDPGVHSLEIRISDEPIIYLTHKPSPWEGRIVLRGQCPFCGNYLYSNEINSPEGIISRLQDFKYLHSQIKEVDWVKWPSKIDRQGHYKCRPSWTKDDSGMEEIPTSVFNALMEIFGFLGEVDYEMRGGR